jgi:hypothetical protein
MMGIICPLPVKIGLRWLPKLGSSSGIYFVLIGQAQIREQMLVPDIL